MSDFSNNIISTLDRSRLAHPHRRLLCQRLMGFSRRRSHRVPCGMGTWHMGLVHITKEDV